MLWLAWPNQSENNVTQRIICTRVGESVLGSEGDEISELWEINAVGIKQ